MKSIIVDENDNIIGYKDSSEFTPLDINRSSILWLTNNKGEILISHRSSILEFCPDKWGYAASGTVDEDETYESNMQKEIEEELGIKRLRIIIGPKIFIDSDPNRPFFEQIYLAQADIKIEDFVLQQDEVLEVKWVKKQWLFEDLKKNPDKYMPSMLPTVRVIYPEFDYYN